MSEIDGEQPCCRCCDPNAQPPDPSEFMSSEDLKARYPELRSE